MSQTEGVGQLRERSAQLRSAAKKYRDSLEAAAVSERDFAAALTAFGAEGDEARRPARDLGPMRPNLRPYRRTPRPLRATWLTRCVAWRSCTSLFAWRRVCWAGGAV